MSYRTPSRKVIAGLASSGRWTDDDVVLAGTDALGCPMQLSRRQAAVPAALVRRWLLVKDAEGQPRLAVVRDFVSGDGYLFRLKAKPARFQPAAAADALHGAGG